jgi:hypothetical protein
MEELASWLCAVALSLFLLAWGWNLLRRQPHGLQRRGTHFFHILLGRNSELRHGKGITPLLVRTAITQTLLLVFIAYTVLEVLAKPLLEVGYLPVKEYFTAFVPPKVGPLALNVFIVGDYQVRNRDLGHLPLLTPFLPVVPPD